jgi:hypothetical protein
MSNPFKSVKVEGRVARRGSWLPGSDLVEIEIGSDSTNQVPRPMTSVGVEVSFVRIEHQNEYLHVSKVEVFNSDGENVALVSKGATAMASSIGWDANNTFPIDGETRSSWPSGCHTLNGPNEWWEVKLPGPTLASKVTITNRAECASRLRGARVVLLDAHRNILQSAGGGRELSSEIVQTVHVNGSGILYIPQLPQAIDKSFMVAVMAGLLLENLEDLFPPSRIDPLVEMGFSKADAQKAYLHQLLQNVERDDLETENLQATIVEYLTSENANSERVSHQSLFGSIERLIRSTHCLTVHGGDSTIGATLSSSPLPSPSLSPRPAAATTTTTTTTTTSVPPRHHHHAVTMPPPLRHYHQEKTG